MHAFLYSIIDSKTKYVLQMLFAFLFAQGETKAQKDSGCEKGEGKWTCHHQLEEFLQTLPSPGLPWGQTPQIAKLSPRSEGSGCCRPATSATMPHFGDPEEILAHPVTRPWKSKEIRRYSTPPRPSHLPRRNAFTESPTSASKIPR